MSDEIPIFKPALDAIRKSSVQPTSSMLVYVALSEIARIERSEIFTATMNSIGSLCGLSRRTVFDRIEELERLNLVRVQRHDGGLKMPLTYLMIRPRPPEETP